MEDAGLRIITVDSRTVVKINKIENLNGKELEKDDGKGL